MKAMMNKGTQFSARFEDVEDFDKRREEARKRMKLEGARESKKAPKRRAGARSSSRGRTSRKRSPSGSPPAPSTSGSSKPRGACFKCASTKHQARDCPSKKNTNVSRAKKGSKK